MLLIPFFIPSPHKGANDMTEESVPEIAQLRCQIDEIDLGLLQLLNTRAEAVLKIQAIKRELGLPAYSPKREDEIIEQVRNANTGPMSAEAVEAVFRMILLCARAWWGYGSVK